jgi:DNA topoisomerase IB
LPHPVSKRALIRQQDEAIAEVAGMLGNIPAVCRKAYIDPLVFAAWRDGNLARAAAVARSDRQWDQAAQNFLAWARRVTARQAYRRGGFNRSRWR